MSSTRFTMPFVQWEDPTGIPFIGGQLFFYLTGTNTPAAVYSDAALTVPITQPVVSLGNGYWPNIFLNPAITYKVVLEDINNNLIWTADPVAPVTIPTSFAYFSFFYNGSAPPVADAVIRGWWVPAAVNFAAGFLAPDSGFKTLVNATASYVITINKNGSAIGTISVATNGSYTLATTGGLAQSAVKGDYITAVGQHVPDATLNTFFGTITGTWV